MMLDGVFVSTWAWTGSFGGIDFYPGAATDNYSIDNLVICSADSMPSVMCADSSACNYESPELCVYPPTGYNCDGGCLSGDSGVDVVLTSNPLYNDEWYGMTYTITQSGTDVVVATGPYSEWPDVPADGTTLQVLTETACVPAGCYDFVQTYTWAGYDWTFGGASGTSVGGSEDGYGSSAYGISIGGADCSLDCAGIPGGSATLDDCGTCDTDTSNDCVILSNCEACAESQGFFCGDDDSNWTFNAPNGCVLSLFVTNGTSDCIDGSDEVSGASWDCEDGLQIPQIVGCMDDSGSACNFNEFANVSGECVYPDAGYDCDGNCLVDTDSDGVCDGDEISGCTDQAAINYSGSATDDDGSCNYPVLGCTDASAGNYNPSATANNADAGDCDYGPWGVTTTACNMTVYLPADLDITVEGLVVTSPIWIGVTNSAGVVSGASLYTPGVGNSISVWEAGSTVAPDGSVITDPGMSSGEELNWIVISEDEDGNEVDLNASVTYGVNQPSTYSCNGLSVLGSISASSVIDQTIELNQGWNIWSTYIDVPEVDLTPGSGNIGSMEAAFADIVNDVVIVKDETGSVYWPAFGLNSIGNITDASGYQVKTSASTDLVISGQLLDESMEFMIEQGWGIIGYVKLDPSDAEAMMAPIVENLVIMKDENGSVYWPIFGLNNIGNMKAGEGYQIKMDAEGMFSYPTGSGRLGYAEEIRTAYYDAAPNTGSNMTIGLPVTSWEVMPAIGDEIAAYDESGRLIGSTSFNGDNIALTVWGDDFTTDAKDGLATGEKVTFKLWNSDTNTESTLVVAKWDTGSDIYTVDGISIASSIVLSGSVSADAYKLYQNVPNPFNGTTTIKFFVPENADVTIGVYNMLGEYVAEVTSDMFNTGKHEVVFDGSDLGQGTYFIRMNTAGFTATKSMNLVK
jgi:hypothetical protein